MSIGDPLDRVDGPAKVAGRARYSAEWPVRGVTYGVLVMSRIASGRITGIDARAARRVSGVLDVLTHENAPRLSSASVNPPVTALQDDRVWYQNQPVALVVADTFEHATDAASRVVVRYAADQAITDMDGALGSAHAPQSVNGGPPDSLRGDPTSALASAPVHIEQTYTTPVHTHNPMEPFAVIAIWDNTRTHLTLYSTTQGVWPERRAIAGRLGIPFENVRVVTKYLGGGFGCRGGSWSHVAIAALAAKHVGRPVKLVMARTQMFGSVGFRPKTIQKIALGATADGKLTAVRHDGISQTSRFNDWTEPVAVTTRALYSCPNVATSHRLVAINAGSPWYTRAPGEATGLFAFESAVDELAYALHMDPLQLRLANYAERDEEKDLPWSSKALRACYQEATARFDWARRTPEPRSMRDGDVLVGLGLATAARPVHRSKSSARVRLNADGTAVVQVGSQDIGTGTYTILTQIAADTLGIPPEKVRIDLGDTDFPETPVSAGSQTAMSTGSAVQAACEELKRRGVTGVDVYGESAPGDERHQYSMCAWGAVCVEVRVDPDLGTIHVSRIVGRYSAGRILNAKTARSQLIGALVWGIGTALLEDTVTDARTGRIVNANLAEYHVPVNADVPDMDVAFVEEHDPYVDPLGVKGIGEVGIIGVNAAIANAVYHATGVRVRDLPITLDKIIAPSNERVS